MLLAICLCLFSTLRAQNRPLLVSLAKDQEWNQLATLVADGLDPNAPYGDGTTALHWSSYHDAHDAARLLLNANADVNATTDLGVTPLWLAAENGSLEMTRLLLGAGADPTVPLLSGETIVMTAAQSGNGEVVRALLAAGADPDAAVTREQTALMWAAHRGHAEAVAALIEFGADVHARSLVREQYVKSEKEQDSSDDYKYWVEQGGNTPLLFAARTGQLESARHLLDAGANIDGVNAFGTSPLIMAVHSGSLELVQYLIEQGADLEESSSGHTALHAAVLRGEQAIVQALLDAGASLQAEVTEPTPVRRQATDYNFHDALIGSTPLWLAARFAEPQIMRALIDAGADVGTSNQVVYPAQRLGENFIVDEGEISLLMAAVGMGHRRLRISWWTPERRAGQLQKSREDFILEAATIAVQAGVDTSLHNAEGQTALAFARERRYQSVVSFLESVGAEE
ncbi:MAG: ankyrin repeat domain-containing protein [Pseudomonadales bacterium]|nr:ankyrin repeat domain-containing protein [Pseudomonadales bacterium]